MRKLIVLLSVVLVWQPLCSFSQKTIHLKQKKSCAIAGVIFAGKTASNENIDFVNSIGQFEPSNVNIEIAENYLLSNRNDVTYVGLGPYYLQNKLANLLCSYKRQYIGYINTDKDSTIVINLLNFKHRKAAKRYFKKWEKEYVFGTGDFYERNTVTFSVNLTRKIVGIY